MRKQSQWLPDEAQRPLLRIRQRNSKQSPKAPAQLKPSVFLRSAMRAFLILIFSLP
jgi:hypothetical protein